jgi:hypothetical protein
MPEPLDAARFVPLAATAAGLTLAPEDLESVTAAFAVLARVAGPLMAFPLPEATIAAAVFTPDDGGTP